MDSEIIQIDVDSVLKQRAPSYYRWMPRFVVRAIERLICQDELNDLLLKVGTRKGVEAAQKALELLDITIHVNGLEHLNDGQRYIFASNHPLGGLDGLALISELGQHYNGHIRFLVNDILMAVKPLVNIFLPVNKYGRQSREAAEDIEREYASENQMLTFPAGMCSRQKSRRAPVADLKWQKAVVSLSTRYHRDVVPIYFEGTNSKCFYRWARWRERLGIKFNAEMILLPREMIKSRGKTFNIYIGEPVPYDTLNAKQPLNEAARLRDIVYTLKNQYKQP
ncbi:MAG: 1-acyl-sn-glycerol-3-phosphate acyltransferase [Muribaculaceae bacterium]|nr:1-acyl-sn-glycerol-3-phosphate acyltransferase [Muribaculaceae bacterium]